MITVKNLSKKYGSLTVLKDISAEIQKGEIITIIGPSGTGKSTFLRCLNLLETPSGGHIEIDGEDILAKGSNVAALRQKMGMVFQSFNLYAHMDIMDNLTIGPRKLLHKSKAEAEKKSMEMLKLVGLAEKAYSFPDELSGGQKQRAAIARCLTMEPEIILFDEPTSALDPTMVSEVLSVIRRLARDGMTMAIVTHEMNFARDVSTTVYYMDEGIIYESGPPEQIFDNPQREKTRAFINRIRSYNYHIGSHNYDLYALNGEIEFFCEKHVIPRKQVLTVQLLVEELLGICVPAASQPDMDLKLSYSEVHGGMELLLESIGELANLLDKAKEDDLGISIIRSMCESIEYFRNDNKNSILIKLKQ